MFEAMLIKVIALACIIKGVVGIVNPSVLVKQALWFQRRRDLVRVLSILILIIGILLFW